MRSAVGSSLMSRSASGSPVHWSIPDPAREGDNDDETYPAFERTADELASRIPFLLELIAHTPSHQEVG